MGKCVRLKIILVWGVKGECKRVWDIEVYLAVGGKGECGEIEARGAGHVKLNL